MQTQFACEKQGHFIPTDDRNKGRKDGKYYVKQHETENKGFTLCKFLRKTRACADHAKNTDKPRNRYQDLFNSIRYRGKALQADMDFPENGRTAHERNDNRAYQSAYAADERGDNRAQRKNANYATL